MYLAILVKTDGKIVGLEPNEETKEKDIDITNTQISETMFASYFYSKNTISDEYIETLISRIDSCEHVKALEIMKYIEGCE